MEPFYMVKGNGPSTCIHADVETAMREAERLSRISPGTKFYVMKAIGFCEKNDVKWEWEVKPELAADPETPF